MSHSPYTAEQLERIERDRDPAVIPELVRTLREQQHDLERLRLSLEVARRDREELRAALLRTNGGRAAESEP